MFTHNFSFRNGKEDLDDAVNDWLDKNDLNEMTSTMPRKVDEWELVQIALPLVPKSSVGFDGVEYIFNETERAYYLVLAVKRIGNAMTAAYDLYLARTVDPTQDQMSLLWYTFVPGYGESEGVVIMRGASPNDVPQRYIDQAKQLGVAILGGNPSVLPIP